MIGINQEQWGVAAIEQFYGGTVLTFKIHNIGTVPMFKIYNIGNAPMLCILNVRTVPM